ncbi:MAG: hypothetical protein HBSAPP03_20640 [Phycisphaerae bacterium]|nr:MAG: hypothetical protein HBSAPP03_20640 [Phycisphaerae bacterium]
MPKKAATTKKSASTKAKKPAAKHPKKAAVKAGKAAKPVVKTKAATKPAKAAEPSKSDSGRKGITIVTPKPVKKAKVPVSMENVIPSGLGRLLDPKSPRKPLIPSGPKASAGRALGQHGGPDKAMAPVVGKSTLTPAQIEHFRGLLFRKRAELAGDVAMMEKEALRSETGSLSNMPSHIAEQGSDASEQAVSLDLAAADRKLIKEIDDAIMRVERGTYGMCELTGKQIKIERLEEIPWARYSIEAARELERHAMRPN